MQGQFVGFNTQNNPVYNSFSTTTTPWHLYTRANPILTYYSSTNARELPTNLSGITTSNVITGDTGICPYPDKYDDNGFTSGNTEVTTRSEFATAKQNWIAEQHSLANTTPVTPKHAEIQNRIYAYRAIMDRTGSAMLRHFSQSNQSDSLLVWWKKVESPAAYIQIAYYFAAKGDYPKAIITIDELIGHFNSDAAAIAEYTKLKSLLNLFTNNPHYTQLGQEQLSYIYTNYANGDDDLARTMARNILELYGYHFPKEHPDYPITEGKMSWNNGNKNTYEIISVYPNPAQTLTSFAWKSTEIAGSELAITIKDINGRLIHSETISKFQGIYEWYTTAVENGIYFYDIILDNGSRLKAGKIIIQK